jgi:hypothetical protein
MMPIAEFWNRIARRRGWNAPPAAGEEVHDELMFHFRELVNDRLAAGLPFEAAWNEAEQQFGSMRRYDFECRSLDLAQRFKWRAVALLAGLVVAAWAWWSAIEVPGRRVGSELSLLRQEVQSLRDGQAALVARAVAAPQEDPTTRPVDLAGVVLADDGKPLSEATVFAILKTWPQGNYQQEAFTATTQADGRFQLPGLVPADDRYAIQVAALKDGFAFKSTYQLKQRKPIARPDPISLQLERAAHVTLVVRDASGQPVVGAVVIPSSRKPRQGNQHLVYFQGSQAAQRTTDAQGRVSLDCFLAGDRAEVYVQVPGNDWNSRKFEVTGEDSVVELASAKS